ncbi:MAG TPA: glycosyltransferase family 4 protein [Solirubrobacterales bacterium]|nr:glycosyltransferase family 4 protein [Solirubrobacterales bacterium]
MRVQIVDPAAYTPPYDHALAGALARGGAEVELVTSHFSYGPVPAGEGYGVSEFFYRRSSREGVGLRRRRVLRAAEHLSDMLRYRRVAEGADVVHYMWLPIPALDRHLLPADRPRLYTMHWRLPDAGTRIGRTLTRLLGEMDAVVVHSEHGARRLEADFGVPRESLRVIPHGAFDYLTRQEDEVLLPEELREVTGPVILAFGLVRPYKGTDVLLEAFRQVEGAELWVVGMPRMPMDELRALARRAPGTVRFVDRFVTDPEIPAFMRRADLVVLPYRNIEQSGVLYTGLAFGRPLVLSSVGGFPEIAAQGAARLVPPGDPDALALTLNELLADRSARDALADAATRAAATTYSWERIGDQTMGLYRDLLGPRR